MIITIHQPEYLPWLGFFDRVRNSDIFVFLDDVQFQKNAWMNRNRIKTNQGWQWLNIPIRDRKSIKNINKIEIDNTKDWKRKQWKAIQFNYSKSPYFKDYSWLFEDFFSHDWKMLAEADIYLIKKIMEILGVATKLEQSSLLNIEGKATDRLVKICQELRADNYLAGPGFTEEGQHHHMEEEKFKEANIKVIRQEFSHPVYPQLFGKIGFVSHLSIVDLLFNCGEKSLEIIKSGTKNI